MLKIAGVFPPIPTSFNKSGKLYPEKMKENLSVLSRFDLSGFLVLGSNGELVMLTESEKTEVYATAREAIPRNKIMLAGTGGQSTLETIRLTRQAAEKGADAALVLNQFYYKGSMTKEALVKHYFEVADASSIPVIIYNMPANTGMDMDAETLVAIAKHPNIIGLKDSGGNIVKMGDVYRMAPDDFQLLAGSAGFLLPALTVGAIGGILALANIAPQLCIDIYRHFQSGNLEEARKLQLKAIPLNTAVTRGWGIPALKEAMDFIGMYGGPVRSPLLPLDEKKITQLHQLLADNQVRV